MSEQERLEKHWSETKGLMILSLGIWFVLSFGIHFFVESLNTVSFLGFPLGFYLAGQGSLVGFVVLIFWFSARQNKIDEKYGFDEGSGE
jgi:putative solute:sodium symporter small subunit